KKYFHSININTNRVYSVKNAYAITVVTI
ncbi:O-antigen biosynthesis protein, partial [Salmonella enterica subsp. enterica]|nr:O-antigen biosynthesis protein [Salmonella enterica]EBA6485648.1 O-antigen biosynthesis protein [Salmonella enterica]EBF0672023.1 O-antigen biosynthesis protein [Salmonella enterica]ECC8862457.1 O-antigen biosynthesis protein [Salmonella enterica subsp. enterica serovar Paratyphi A]EDS6692411.1 O-antigen biosynthesis protein [Salmonella enterica subsp. enterica serovar Paratyphi A]